MSVSRNERLPVVPWDDERRWCRLSPRAGERERRSASAGVRARACGAGGGVRWGVLGAAVLVEASGVWVLEGGVDGREVEERERPVVGDGVGVGSIGVGGVTEWVTAAGESTLRSWASLG